MVRIEPVAGAASPPTSPASAATLPASFPYPPQEPAFFPAHIPYYSNPFPYGFWYGAGVFSGYGNRSLYDLNCQPRSWYPGPVAGSEGGSGLEMGTTTVMIRNIPTRLRRDELLRLLNDHCREENKGVPRQSPNHQSAYDFVYLPFDFRKKGNLGYAFVNFTTARAAFGFYRAWNGRGWLDFYHCPKICAVTRAVIQKLPSWGVGEIIFSACTNPKVCYHILSSIPVNATSALMRGKGASKRHLERCIFFCDTDDYLPVGFHPPCNGYNAAIATITSFGVRVCKGEKSGGRFWRRKGLRGDQ